MDLLQKKLLYKTKLHSSSVNWIHKRLWNSFTKFLFNQKKKIYSHRKKEKGFISILFLPFLTLIMIGFIGLSSLSVGIKNITKTQSYCIKTTLKGQKELGVLLTKILNLNTKVLFFHNTRLNLEKSMLAATALGLVGLIPLLKKSLDLTKKAQTSLIIKQKYLLTQSDFIKKKLLKSFKNQLKKLSVSNVKEKTFYKKALAVKEEKIGDKAYTYRPVADFINHQKIQFSWQMNPFFPLDQHWKLFFQTKQKINSSYKCTASLKQKGEIWISTLYH